MKETYFRIPRYMGRDWHFVGNFQELTDMVRLLHVNTRDEYRYYHLAFDVTDEHRALAAQTQERHTKEIASDLEWCHKLQRRYPGMG